MTTDDIPDWRRLSLMARCDRLQGCDCCVDDRLPLYVLEYADES